MECELREDIDDEVKLMRETDPKISYQKMANILGVPKGRIAKSVARLIKMRELPYSDWYKKRFDHKMYRQRMCDKYDEVSD